jgi:branched-chain amino acid transport system substrate-binding protein
VAVVGGESDTPVWTSNSSFFPSVGTVDASVYMQPYAAKLAGATSFAPMYCAEVASCASVVPLMKTDATRIGLSFSYSAAISASASSYTPQCVSAAQRHVAAILMDAADTVGKRVMTDCAAQGYQPIWVVPSGGYDPSYLTLPAAAGAYVPMPQFSWFGSGQGPATFRRAMAEYEPSTPLGPNSAAAWSGGVLFGAAASRAGKDPTRASIFTGLYAIPAGDTLGGITPPLYFHKGKPATGSGCFYLAQIKSGRLTSPRGTAAICPVGA